MGLRKSSLSTNDLQAGVCRTGFARRAIQVTYSCRPKAYIALKRWLYRRLTRRKQAVQGYRHQQMNGRVAAQVGQRKISNKNSCRCGCDHQSHPSIPKARCSLGRRAAPLRAQSATGPKAMAPSVADMWMAMRCVSCMALLCLCTALAATAIRRVDLKQRETSFAAFEPLNLPAIIKPQYWSFTWTT